MRQGAAALASYVRESSGIGWDESTADGGLSLTPVACIGLCNGAPCGVLDGRSLVRLTPAKLAKILGRPAPL
jgi:NADH:ubiquinone oxidoreductase subunit E